MIKARTRTDRILERLAAERPNIDLLKQQWQKEKIERFAGQQMRDLQIYSAALETTVYIQGIQLASLVGQIVRTTEVTALWESCEFMSGSRGQTRPTSEEIAQNIISVITDVRESVDGNRFAVEVLTSTGKSGWIDGIFVTLINKETVW